MAPLSHPVDFDLGRFHAGDDTLFAELVATHSPRLWRHLHRYAGGGVDAHDLLQEVWLRAFRKRHTFEGRGSFAGWLLTICRTVGLAALRRRARDSPAIDAACLPAPPHDASEVVLDTVLALPERQCEVVLLRLVEGLSTVETARRMQCSEGTVKSALHEATRKLRDQLKEVVR